MTRQTQTLHLTNLHCGACVARAEAAMIAVPGVQRAEVNPATAILRLTYDGTLKMSDALAALSRAGTPARTTRVTFDIQNMNCGACAARIEQTLSATPGVLAAQANLVAGTASATVLDGGLTPANLAEILAAAGYPAHPQDTAPTSPQPDPTVELARMTRIAAALTVPVVILEMGAHMIPAFHHWIMATIGHQTSWLIQFALTTLVLIWPGARFYRLGFPALLRHAPDMNALVALGTFAAWSFSTVALFAPSLLPAGTRVVYFEAAAVIVTLILLGRTLEARAKGRTGAAIRKLLTLRPKTARVVEGESVTDRPVASLQAGDLVRIRPGETIPTDGILQTGQSYIDESSITGEPIAVHKQPGDALTGGTVNGAGVLDLRATAVGEATVLSQIIRMVGDAQAARLPIQSLVNRVTLWFVPTVIAIALLTVLVWLIIGPDPALALVAGVSVLIIACPCAMGLATPTSIMVGTGRGAELGVLFRKGDALQSLQSARIVAFDKTGTLTEGRPVLTDLIPAPGFDPDDVLRRVASVEAQSEHPIAGAIVAHAEAWGLTLGQPEQAEAIPGFGIQATLEGQKILIGAARLMARHGIAIPQDADPAGAGKTPIYVAIDGRFTAAIAVADPVKRGAQEAIRALQGKGLRVAMVTGDATSTAENIAATLGIDTVIAEVLPIEKAQHVKALQRFGPVAFVGDGINDAPALATADIGIAIGTGTDVAIEAADVVLMSGALHGVVNAVEISRKTLSNIRQNLVWAFGYNVLLIPVAAGVFYPLTGLLLSPVLAAGAMTLSSLFVLGNALRLRWIAAPKSAPTDRLPQEVPA